MKISGKTVYIYLSASQNVKASRTFLKTCYVCYLFYEKENNKLANN